MSNTKIEWCDVTINPVIGCTHECPYCYAKRINNRFGWIEDWNQPEFFPNQLMKLKNIKKPKNIFMNSMSDIADWSSDTIMLVGYAMQKNPQHNYLFLTKRPRKSIISGKPNFLWLGTTITRKSECRNLSFLIRRNVVRNYFVSIEPIHEYLDFFKSIEDKNIGFTGKFKELKWIIIGAETGNRKNKVIPNIEWIVEIVFGAKKRNIPVFMKDSLIPIVGEENMIREFPTELRKV